MLLLDLSPDPILEGGHDLALFLELQSNALEPVTESLPLLLAEMHPSPDLIDAIPAHVDLLDGLGLDLSDLHLGLRDEPVDLLDLDRLLLRLLNNELDLVDLGAHCILLTFQISQLLVC
jgi:hypothetical protein